MQPPASRAPAVSPAGASDDESAPSGATAHQVVRRRLLWPSRGQQTRRSRRLPGSSLPDPGEHWVVFAHVGLLAVVVSAAAMARFWSEDRARSTGELRRPDCRWP